MDLLRLARESSGDLHQSIESTAVAQAMSRGTIDRAVYGRVMALLARVHEIVETRLDRSSIPELKRASFRRRHLAEADCRTLGQNIPPEDAALTAWRQWLDARTNLDWVLAGILYVLEGSRMGSRMLLAPLAQALGAALEPGQGLDYHLAAAADRDSWGAFKSFLESASPTPDEQTAFAEGVRSTFELLCGQFVNISLPFPPREGSGG